MRTLLFTKGLLSFSIIFILGMTTLVAQEEASFENHKKGNFTVGLNLETVTNSEYRGFFRTSNLDLGYHITDKWSVGARIKMNGSKNSINLGTALYARYYLLDFGKRDRVSWFVEGGASFDKQFYREPIPNYTLAGKLGTGVDVAITKSLMFTGQVFYEKTRYDLGDVSYSTNNLGLSIGLKWTIGNKK